MALTQVQAGMVGTLTPTNLDTQAQYTGFKNRIINGAMVIDQRNAGASVTASGTFPVDRFKTFKDTVSGTLTAQRSTIAPAGFINSLSYTVTNAFTPSSSEGNSFTQQIEGYNIADLGWGTSNAQSVTLSFWVRSSLTGQFGGSLRNSASNRSYPFSYTISVANTFEYKTVTVTGDTTGTWLADNGTGMFVFFSLGTGSGLTGTAGAWTSSNIINTTGSVNVTSTAGATFYITGVQLEKGSTATSFDYRSIGTELALCQRYAIVYSNASDANNRWFGYNYNGTSSLNSAQFPVTMRSAPTATISTANTFTVYSQNALGNPSAVTLDTASAKNVNISATISTTIGLGTIFAMNDNSNKITFSAEL